MVKYDLKKIAEKYGFEPRSIFYLDSIVFQREEQSKDVKPRELKKQVRETLNVVCEIAFKYQDPIAALRIIDGAIDKRNPSVNIDTALRLLKIDVGGDIYKSETKLSELEQKCAGQFQYRFIYHGTPSPAKRADDGISRSERQYHGDFYRG